MIKAIIFDVDGVIINTGFFTKRLESDFNIPVEKTRSFFKGRFQECQLGKADLKEELQKVVSDWGWTKSVDDLLDYWFEDSKNNVNQILVNEIKDYRQNEIKCYLGTNQEEYRSEYLKNTIGLKNVLDGFFVSSEIGFRKPAKEFFESISKELSDLNKTEVLFWDSDEEIVEAAKEFGFNAELYVGYDDFKSKMTSYLDNK